MSFVRVIDTMCDGWQCEKDQHGNPFTYETKEEAQRELNADFQELRRNQIKSGMEPDEEPDEFIIQLSEYVEGRKAVYYKERFNND